jgi:hypothetical protein
MREDAVKTEMRLFVLETLVALMWASHHKTAPEGPAASVANLRERLIDKARRQMFSDIDPTLSEAYSAELEADVDEALALQEGWLGL